MKRIYNVEYIESLRIGRGLSKSRFCKECHIGYGTYQKILRHQLNVSCYVPFKIARYFKVCVHLMYDDE